MYVIFLFELYTQPKEAHVSHPQRSDEQSGYFARLGRAKDGDPGIPIFLRKGGEFYFIPDVKMASEEALRFEREAPPGLYRGTAATLVTWQGGILAVPDERYSWFKPFAGNAEYKEANDLKLTGRRELMEEVFVYDLEKTTRFVPQGAGMGCIHSSQLGFTVNREVEVGEISLVRYQVNERNRAYEAVLTWDISEIDVPFSVSLEEEWFNGDSSGIPVFVLNTDGTVRGVFSGQQGFIALNRLAFHPVLKTSLSCT